MRNAKREEPSITQVGSADRRTQDSQVQFIKRPDSDLIINLTSTERLLRHTPLIAVGEVRCPASHPTFAAGGPQTCHYIGFMRSTVIRIARHGAVVQTPNVAGFHNVGSTYERRAVTGTGDHSDWIAMAPSLVEELSDRLARKDKGGFFASPFAPVAARTYVAQRHLFEVLNAPAEVSDLQVEEYVIRLIRAALYDASDFWNAQEHLVHNCRSARKTHSTDAVEAVKLHLAIAYAGDDSLTDLARLTQFSVGHLAREFPKQTGFSIHEYRQQIRLRVSLELLRESRFDLSDVATQLGFASHSHFSAVFRRKFGIQPSEFAKSRSRGLLKSFLDLLDQDTLQRARHSLF